jgi:hypothetical protein
MLSAFHKDEKVNGREMLISVLLNTFPSYFLHLPTTFFIILPLLGIAGIHYLLLTFAAALLRVLLVTTCAHFVLPARAHPIAARKEAHRGKDWKTLLRETGQKFRKRLSRVLAIVVPVYLIMTGIADLGFFVWLRGLFALGITTAFVPVEAMSIVVFSLVAEFTSGFAAAGAMLGAGTLSVSQTILALLVGNIIAAPVRALRHQLPYYMGIFSPGTGLRLILASQGLRVGSLVAVGVLYLLFFSL